MGIEPVHAEPLDTRTDSIFRRVRKFQDRMKASRELGIAYGLPSTPDDGAWILVDGKRYLNFSSYSYLGLIGHHKIQLAASEAIDAYGTGTHGARLLSGTLPIHRELERKVASLKGTDDAATFSTGYATNVAAISSLLGRGDVVINDRLNHASIVDGALLSGAQVLRFKHNDMPDLERVLKNTAPANGRLVAVDAVFSMDGDVADLPRIIELCQRYNAWLMVDEAHSFGVLGKAGNGILSHFGLSGGIDLHMGTFSKTIPSVGGYIAAKQEVIEFLRHNARPYVFSAALPAVAAAAASAALDVFSEEPERHEKLHLNVALFRQLLEHQGLVFPSIEAAIFPIVTGNDISAWRMAAYCAARGISIMPIVPPAVPVQLSRLRVIVTASHTPEDLEMAASVLGDAAREHRLIR